MPNLIHEDDVSQTFQDDGGQIFTIPKGTALAGGAALQGAPAPFGGPPGLPPMPDLSSLTGVPQTLPSQEPPPAPGPESVTRPSAGLFPPTEAPAAPDLAPIAATPALAPAKPRPAPAPPSLEQQIGNAAVAGANALDDQGAIAQQQGDVLEQQKAAEAELLRQRNERADQIQADAAKQQQADQEHLAQLNTKYDAAVTAEADHHVDEGRRWKDAGTGRRIGAAIAIALSGLGEALKGNGGKNPALDLIQADIDRDVQAQIRDHEQLKGRIGEVGSQIDRFRQISGERGAAYGLKMATELERTARQIEASAASYGSPLAKLNGEAAAADLRARKAEYVGKAAESAWTRDMSNRQINEQIAARKASNALQGAGLKQSAYQFAEQMRRQDITRADESLQRWTALAQDADKAKAAGNAAGAKAALEQIKTEKETAIGGPPQIVTGKDGAPRVSFGLLKNADGSLFTAPTKEAAQKLRDSKAATDTTVNLIDSLVRAREQHGWESALWKSDEYKAMQSQWQDLKLSKAGQAQLGALSESDLAMLEGSLGGDPSGVRDPTAGLRTARQTALRKLNDQLHADGFDGSYDIPEATNAGFQDRAKNSYEGNLSQTIAAGSERGRQVPLTASYDLDPSYGDQYRDDPKVNYDTTAANIGTPIDAQTRLAISQAVQAAKSGRPLAVDLVRQLAGHPNARVRDYLRDAASMYQLQIPAAP